MQAKSGGVREVAADFDDSVITVFAIRIAPTSGITRNTMVGHQTRKRSASYPVQRNLLTSRLRRVRTTATMSFLTFLSALSHRSRNSGCSKRSALTEAFLMMITLRTLKTKAMSTSSKLGWLQICTRLSNGSVSTRMTTCGIRQMNAKKNMLCSTQPIYAYWIVSWWSYQWPFH
jgi:hypothetical protein